MNNTLDWQWPCRLGQRSNFMAPLDSQPWFTPTLVTRPWCFCILLILDSKAVYTYIIRIYSMSQKSRPTQRNPVIWCPSLKPCNARMEIKRPLDIRSKTVWISSLHSPQATSYTNMLSSCFYNPRDLFALDGTSETYCIYSEGLYP